MLVAGLAITAVVTLLLGDLALERRRQQFRADAAQAQATITAKVETSLALLRGTAGLFAGYPGSVTPAQFRAYIGRVGLRERYPGILGIGFARILRPGSEEAVAAELRAQGQEGFRVWPFADDPQLRTTIAFLEPLDVRNKAAVGYDMATHPVRRAAMERARDSGQIAASGVVQLVQEIDAQKQPGFLLYTPVYAGGATPAAVEERRAQLLGFAYSPIRAVDFLSGAFRHEATPTVQMSVYVGIEPAPSQLLYSRGENGVAQREPGLRTMLNVAGMQWLLVFRPRTPSAEALLQPAIVGAVGVMISLLASLLVARERRATAQARSALEAERTARGEAERANRMKDEFLATLSHELRTPLHAILGWTSLLHLPRLTEEQRRQGIGVIERNARTQARLIEDLLDMNRIATGKITLDLRRTDLGEVVVEALRSIRPAFAERGVTLEAHAIDTPLTVRGDPARLLQVVNNLISNALKFTPGGGRVDVSLSTSLGQAVLQVKDTGQGIEAEFLGRLFERFAQADSSASRRHGGLGLGLAIARQLVELHGGSIRAESDGPGCGATFTVRLPLASVESASEAVEERVGPHALREVRVLVVDDEPDARELIAAILSAHGAVVRTAGSVDEALQALRADLPDVLLSDVSMPVKDGYTLLRLLRALPDEHGGRLPAAAITAYARDVDRRAAFAAGFDAHLSKPLQGDSLVQAVAELARRAVARQETIA